MWCIFLTNTQPKIFALAVVKEKDEGIKREYNLFVVWGYILCTYNSFCLHVKHIMYYGENSFIDSNTCSLISMTQTLIL